MRETRVPHGARADRRLGGLSCGGVDIFAEDFAFREPSFGACLRLWDRMGRPVVGVTRTEEAMTIKQLLYLAISLLGLLIPWYFNLQFMEETGTTLLSFSIADFVRAGFSNPAAACLSADLVIGASAASVFIVLEGRRLAMKHWWVYLVLTNLVAFAFAFPLFLFVRERQLDRGTVGGVS